VLCPRAAGINIGGHYEWHFVFSLYLSPLSSGSLLIIPEAIVVGFCNFAWLLSNKHIGIPTKNTSENPLTPYYAIFGRKWEVF
jgi:hypothetical protein